MDEKIISFKQELVPTPETDSKRELPPTPDISPIIRPTNLKLPFLYMRPKLVLSWTKCKASFWNCYLTLQKYIRHKNSKENYKNKLGQGCGKGSKGNKLKASYKDRLSKNTLQIRNEKPLYYKNSKEFLFYKERMTKVKMMMRLRGREKKLRMRTDKKRREG